MAQLPLEGIRVLELGTAWAGPFAARLLADLGAEVIKIESIQMMDNSRGGIEKGSVAGAYPDGDPGERPYNRRGVFHQWNRNKLGITLNLKSAKGVEIFKRLVRLADVIIQNAPPRVLKSLGLDYPVLREINPSLIMISLPAFGASGPESGYIAYGLQQELMAGGGAMTGYVGEGEVPIPTGIWYGDPTAGATAAALALTALIHRRRTGMGQWIDVSQCEATILLFGEAIMDYMVNQRLGKPMGNRHPWMAPHGCYRCRGDDNWVVISISTDEEWRSLCSAMGNPSLTERFPDLRSRRENQDGLDRLIQEWTIQRDHLEVVEVLQRAGVPAGAVLDPQQRAEDPHLRERGFLLRGSKPEVGSYLYQGAPMRLSRSPITIRRLAPSLGEHNGYVLGELLGMSQEEIAALEREQVIGTVPLPGADRGM